MAEHVSSSPMKPGKKKPSSGALSTGMSLPNLLAASSALATVQSALSITPVPSLALTRTAPVRIRRSLGAGASINRPKYIFFEDMVAPQTRPEKKAEDLRKRRGTEIYQKNTIYQAILHRYERSYHGHARKKARCVLSEWDSPRTSEHAASLHRASLASVIHDIQCLPR
jgi:hypothetical protein